MLLPTLCTYNSDIFRCSLFLEQEFKNSFNKILGVVNLCIFNAKHPFKFDPIFPRFFWKYRGVCLPMPKADDSLCRSAHLVNTEGLIRLIKSTRTSMFLHYSGLYQTREDIKRTSCIFLTSIISLFKFYQEITFLQCQMSHVVCVINKYLYMQIPIHLLRLSLIFPIRQAFQESCKPGSYSFFLNYVHITYQVFLFIQKYCLSNSENKCHSCDIHSYL